MQRCTATVRLSGDMLNTIQKSGLSPAEIVILRHIHGGEDAVVDIQPNFMDKTTHANERERLNLIYTPAVVERVFPGQFSRLPVSLKEITTSYEQEAEEEAAKQEEPDVMQEDHHEDDRGEQDPVADVEPPPEALSDELDVDDKELVDRIMAAGSKKELTELAEENEVDLTGRMSEKMTAIKEYIVKSLFPNYQP